MSEPSTPSLDVAGADPDGLPVVVGCPFPPGYLKNIARLALHSEAPLAIDARPLVTWPDGSVRWALLSFRSVRAGLCDVRQEDAPPNAGATVRVIHSSAGTVIDNGLTRVHLSADGPGPITRIETNGRVIFDRADQLQFTVGDASTLHDAQRTIEVLESGAQRARVRVSGAHFDASGKRNLSYRLDIELWAGWSSVRLDYQFFNLERGATSRKIRRMRMICTPNVGDDIKRHVVQLHHGEFMEPRSVVTESPVAIRADASRQTPYVEDVRMLGDDEAGYVPYLKPSIVDTSDWLGLLGSAGGAYVRMQQLVAMRPKRLWSEGAQIGLDIWPEEASMLDLPQGRSRRQTIMLAFTPPDVSPLSTSAVNRSLSALAYEGRATPSPEWLRAMREFDLDRMLAPGQSARMEKYIWRMMSGISLSQGMFDLGDGIEAGYTENYIRTGRQPLRPEVTDAPNPMQVKAPRGVDYAGDDRFEPVWANNEYDLIHALAIEMMRKGKDTLWPILQNVARHNIEVDFVHYSDDPWQHHGSPAHSARHNFSSAYPSHLWTQGLLEYYCLTGDRDALEVATLIGDTIIRNLTDPGRRKFLWGFNREVGWPVLALVALYDLARDARIKQHLDEIIEFLMAYECAKAPVNLSGNNPRHDAHRRIVSSFFGYASMIEGIDRYARITDRGDIRAWLTTFTIDLLDAAERASADGQSIELRQMLPLGMAIGFELTANKRFLEVGMLCLEDFMDTEAWTHPPTEVKAIAMIHRSMVRFLEHAQRTGMLDELEHHFAKRAKSRKMRPHDPA